MLQLLEYITVQVMKMSILVSKIDNINKILL